jgi:hypothetical protein
MVARRFGYRLGLSHMTVARKNWPAPSDAPDLAEFRRHYPLTVANFGALGEREVWLRNIWAAGARCRQNKRMRPTARAQR